MKVSVVIPAYNAQQTIGAAVAQSLAQAREGLEVEVIVVDDGSTDHTAEMARMAGALVIRQQNVGPASARNRGWQSATGLVICFMDSDCIPAKNWLASLLEGFKDGKIGAVAGSYDIANRRSWLARWVHQEIIQRHDRMPSFIRAFGSYNVAIPNYVLEATGGFDCSYRRASGEDNDLSYRILKEGWLIAFRPQAKVAHYHPERLWRYLKEQYRHGFWRAKLYKDHPEMTAGDDYTRFRDGVEPILVLGSLGLAALVGLGLAVFILPWVGILAFYAFIQLSWPVRWWLNEGKVEALPYAGVTFLRGIARTLGLCVGMVRFGLKRAERGSERQKPIKRESR